MTISARAPDGASGHGADEHAPARCPRAATMNGHSALCEGPVGVPNVVEAPRCSGRSGPGAPTSLTISGAKIAARISTTITPSEIERDPVAARNRRQNSCSGERAAISPPPVSASRRRLVFDQQLGDAPTLIGLATAPAAPQHPPLRRSNHMTDRLSSNVNRASTKRSQVTLLAGPRSSMDRARAS